ncbi:hypothetical protein J6590_063605 [Homalodisca vitripennis]|nr:hypothetical protein J6590_063605 [Homalodisca vitripennis]
MSILGTKVRAGKVQRRSINCGQADGRGRASGGMRARDFLHRAPAGPCPRYTGGVIDSICPYVDTVTTGLL